MDVFTYQLGAPLDRGPYGSVEAFHARLAACPFAGHVERALFGGFHADRLGYAFAAGYDAALRRLFEHAGVAPPSGTVCLAATEGGGAHPRAIATRLDGDVLRGEKTFATLATIADAMLVVASRGEGPDGRNRLVVVRVARDARGVQIEPRAPTPFAPEIPHAIVRLDGVRIREVDVLPGDGYERWLKPFRTIEDVHVLAASLGYLAGAARAHGAARDVVAEVVALGVTLVELGARDPGDPVGHIALAGLFAWARKLAAALAFPGDEGQRFQRDLPLLLVAEGARQKRTDAALAALARAVTSSA